MPFETANFPDTNAKIVYIWTVEPHHFRS